MRIRGNPICKAAEEGYFCTMGTVYHMAVVLLLLLPFGKGHEFYVGLTEVEYNPAARTYEVSIKLFTDDLELAIQKSGGVNPHLGTLKEHADADTLVFAYTSKHFNLSGGKGSAITLKPVGRETELDVTWIYLESAPTQPSNALVVINEMIMELYESQTHVVHVKQEGRISTELWLFTSSKGKP